MEQQKQQPKKMKKGLKIFLIILGVLLGLILATVLVFAILNQVSSHASLKLAESFAAVENPDAVKPEQEANGTWTFRTDRDLKVLQLTDIHIGAGCLSAKKDAMAINAVASMVTAEKPDLVIVTGDIAYPVPFQAGTMNNLKAAKIFSTLMERLGVPWIPVFGNHDTEVYSYYTREDISEFYESDALKTCLFRKNAIEDIDGFGNSYITVKNADDIVTQALFLLDSHSYTDDDKFGILWHYDNIHQNQIDWYKNSVLELNKQNAARFDALYKDDAEKLAKAKEQFGDVTSMLFFHIPSQEYKTAWNEYVQNGYKDTENVKLHYGVVGEKGCVISCPIEDDQLFETMQSLGGKKGVFCGHDHMNNYCLDYKGIRLTYGYSVDYLAYIGISAFGSQRGCTIITLGQDGDFKSELSSYYQDKYQMLSDTPKEEVTMQDLFEAGQPLDNEDGDRVLPILN